MPAEFLHSVLLDGNGGRRVLDAAAIAEWTPDNGLLWLHIDISDESARSWLEQDSGLPETVIDSLLAAETRPRSQISDAGSLVVLRGVNTNPGDDPEDMVSVRIWLEPKRIISTRRRRLLSVQDVRSSLENGVGPATVGEFLVELIGCLADRIGDFVNAIEDRISEVEDSGGITWST